MNEKNDKPEKLVFLAMPAGEGRPNVGAAQAFYQLASQRDVPLIQFARNGSALGQNFNVLWSSALGNPKVTHFAMLHSDLIPSAWWLDTLMDEMERTGADVISAVNAIKDTKGLSSTSVGYPDDEWDYRRITTTELQSLPVTFGIEDVPDSIRAGGRDVLLVNTGCWLCDLRRPWWRDTDDSGCLKFHFTQDDRITYDEQQGKYVVEFAPEDWLFSRMCHAAGAKVLATTAVRTSHVGTRGFTVDHAWGQLKTDSEADNFHRMKPLAKQEILA